MTPADQRWWRDQENSSGLVCQHGLVSPAESPQLAFVATAAAAVVGGVVAAAASTVAAAGTAAGEAVGGGRATVPAGHETQFGPHDL